MNLKNVMMIGSIATGAAVGIFAAGCILLLLPTGAIAICAAFGGIIPVFLMGSALHWLTSSNSNSSDASLGGFLIQILIPTIAVSAILTFCLPFGVAFFGLGVACAVSSILINGIEKWIPSTLGAPSIGICSV